MGDPASWEEDVRQALNGSDDDLLISFLLLAAVGCGSDQVGALKLVVVEILDYAGLGEPALVTHTKSTFPAAPSQLSCCFALTGAFGDVSPASVAAEPLDNNGAVLPALVPPISGRGEAQERGVLDHGLFGRLQALERPPGDAGPLRIRSGQLGCWDIVVGVLRR